LFAAATTLLNCLDKAISVVPAPDGVVVEHLEAVDRDRALGALPVCSRDPEGFRSFEQVLARFDSIQSIKSLPLAISLDGQFLISAIAADLIAGSVLGERNWRRYPSMRFQPVVREGDADRRLARAESLAGGTDFVYWRIFWLSAVKYFHAPSCPASARWSRE
jgi:hypothetical protein